MIKKVPHLGHLSKPLQIRYLSIFFVLHISVAGWISQSLFKYSLHFGSFKGISEFYRGGFIIKFKLFKVHKKKTLKMLDILFSGK